MSNIFGKMVGALYRDRHSVKMQVILPAQLYMALETLIYIRNETDQATDKDPVDRDFIIGLALSYYLTEHLTKQEAKIAAIPPAPDRLYTNGRKQNRTGPSYQDTRSR
jgi:hypothetical protein